MAQASLIVREGKKELTLSFTETSLFVKDKQGPQRDVIVPIYQVISAYYLSESHTLEISYAHQRKTFTAGPHLALVNFVGQVDPESDSKAVQWTESLMKIIYEAQGIKRSRRLKVFVNPHGGVGKGVQIFLKTLLPVFNAARCSLDTTFTTHSGHAHDIVKDMPLEFDAIITVSGDGLVHEVINGLALSSQPTKALGIPICPVPTGSGNGLSLNLLGIQDGFDVVAAALNAIKGQPMHVDLFSIMQNGKRTLSFMSQALGLFADLDIGTDHLRRMGEARFVYGYLRGVALMKPCPITISFKLEESDKLKMAQGVQNRKKQVPSPDEETHQNYDLPSLKQLPEEETGWTTLDSSLLYVYAGKGPYVGRDLMAFPVSLPDDGLIDIMVQEVSNRADLLKERAGAPQGDLYWNPKIQYYKASAYRVQPKVEIGNLSIDGERFPFEPYQVEVHKRLGTFLSPLGMYAADFPLPLSTTAPVKKP